jgi:glycosyltransferase involved in cell wall biosynthesis
VDRARARTQLGIEADEVAVGSFGFTNASKGMDVLLRAAERLIRAGVPLRLLLIGDETGSSDERNRETAAHARALGKELGLEDRIIRTGYLSAAEVSQALGAVDVAALPYTDGVSFRRSSLLTCLAHGVPVVTTRASRAVEIPAQSLVTALEGPPHLGLSGVVAAVPPGDDAALARAIYRLLDDPEQRTFLSTAGRSFANRLTWPSIARATIEVYRSVH